MFFTEVVVLINSRRMVRDELVLPSECDRERDRPSLGVVGPRLHGVLRPPADDGVSQLIFTRDAVYQPRVFLQTTVEYQSGHVLVIGDRRTSLERTILAPF